MDIDDQINRLEAIIEFFNPEEVEESKSALEQSIPTEYSPEQVVILKKINSLGNRLQKITTARKYLSDLQGAREIGDEGIELLGEELFRINKFIRQEEQNMLFSGKFDGLNCTVQIYAGAGGTEARDWAEMIMRMYLRFCESDGLTATVTYILEGEDAGVQSAELEITGDFAFGKLKGEAGTHRLVRQSPFNANALRQTSFCGVIVTPIVEEASDVEIKESDLQIDSFRSSGKGGQSVNTTNSAVRVKHLPTGITVARQDQRSFEQNKASAIESLRAKLKLLQEQEFQAELEAIKQGGDVANFGTQIRNYVLHPYKLVKDLRTGFESKEPEKVLDGDLGEFVDSYIRWLIINSDKP